MSLNCPECGHRLNPLRVLWFLRILSVPCAGCHTLLSLDGEGRRILVWTAIGSVLLTVLVGLWVRSTFALVSILIAGQVFCCLQTMANGELVVSSEDSRDSTS